MDVEVIDSLKPIIRHQSSTQGLNTLAASANRNIPNEMQNRVLSDHNSPKKRKEWNTARVVGTGRNLFMKPTPALV
jgi:hypothetical protein